MRCFSRFEGTPEARGIYQMSPGFAFSSLEASPHGKPGIIKKRQNVWKSYPIEGVMSVSVRRSRLAAFGRKAHPLRVWRQTAKNRFSEHAACTWAGLLTST